MAVQDWSTTAALNATLPGINFAEGQLPGTVNNSMRQVLADLATYFGSGAQTLKQADGTVVGTYGTLDAYTGTGTATAGAPRVFYGKNTSSGDDSAILIGRGLVGTDLRSHAVRDESTFTSTTSAYTSAYTSFDAAVTYNILGTQDHSRGFQFRGSFGGAGTLGEVAAFWTGPIVTSGTVTAVYGLKVSDASKSGGATIAQQIGVRVDALSAGASNFAFYADSNPSYLGGNLQIAGTFLGATTGVFSSQLNATSIEATGNAVSFATGGGVSVTTGGVQAYSNSSGTGKTLGLNLTGGGLQTGSAALPVYADNTAAAALAVGTFYRTATGVVMIRY